MKRLIFSLMMLILITSVKAQTSPYPCVATFYVINNHDDGTMVVTFSSPLPTPQSAPQILAIVNTTLGVQLNGTFTWMSTVTGKTSTTTTAYYSYHAGVNGQKLSNGSGSELHYQITIQYPGFDPQTCDVINTPPPSTLPVKFVSLNTKSLGNNLLQVDFEIAEATNVSQFNIQISKDGINWQTVGLVFPDNVQPNRLYSIKIDLSKTPK